MLGVDLLAIPTIGVETAPTIAAEIGADLSRFPSVGHFCSWLGLAPGTRISGDKRLKGAPRRQSNRVGQALRMAAPTARSDLRQRDGLVGERSRAVHHMQKALVRMNVQLDNVLSDIMGKTGQLIVRAIVAGERDGAVLAGFRDGRCKADAATIAASLRGNWRDEHLFALAQALERHDALQGQIAACEERIDAELDKLARADADDPPEDRRSRKGRDRALRRRLKRMLGVDLLAIPTIGMETALIIAAEIGAVLSQSSWTGRSRASSMAPNRRCNSSRE